MPLPRVQPYRGAIARGVPEGKPLRTKARVAESNMRTDYCPAERERPERPGAAEPTKAGEKRNPGRHPLLPVGTGIVAVSRGSGRSPFEDATQHRTRASGFLS